MTSAFDRTSMWRWPLLLICFGLALGASSLSACGDVREVSGVYTEEMPTIEQEGRRYALRMTIFEYDGFVGGWIEYYALGVINRVDAPYIQPDYCAYFGPLRRADELTVIRAESPGDRHLLLRAAPDGRRILHAEVANDGGIFEEGTAAAELLFEKQKDAPDARCPEEATLLGRVQEIPHTRTEEPPAPHEDHTLFREVP